MTSFENESTSYELTEQILVDCATAQNFPVEVLEQAGNTRMEFTRKDFFAGGGYLNLNAWEIRAEMRGGEQIGWRVQLTLSAWVNSDTFKARRASQPLDKQSMLKFSMKLRRQVFLYEELSAKSNATLEELYQRQVGGNDKCAASVFVKPEFLLQFTLKPVDMRVTYDGNRTQVEEIRLIGDEVFITGFDFFSGFAGRGVAERIRPREDFSSASDIMQRLAKRRGAIQDVAAAPAVAPVAETAGAEEESLEESIF